MSKAILEIENVPKDCYSGCPLMSDHVCNKENKDVTAWMYSNCRPDWCPLNVVETIEDIPRDDKLRQLLQNISIDESLKFLHQFTDEDRYSSKCVRAHRVAIHALEKQKKKPPIDISVDHAGRVGNCPCCNKLVTELIDDDICAQCGQGIDWSK